MEQPNNLFGIAVNSLGKESIKRFAKLARWIIVFGILIIFLQLGNNFIRVFYLHPMLKGNVLVRFSNLVEICWVFGYLILSGLQLYFLGKISNALSTAVNSDDEETFNQGLKHLFQYSVVGMIAVIAGFIMSAFDMLVSFRYYKVI